MKTQKILVAVLAMQIITLLNQWFGSPISTAQAQIPDAGAQRLQMIDELKTNNDELKGIDEKLDKLVSILGDGKLQVQMAKPDETREK